MEKTYTYNDMYLASENYKEYMQLCKKNNLDEGEAQEFWVEMTADFNQ